MVIFFSIIRGHLCDSAPDGALSYVAAAEHAVHSTLQYYIGAPFFVASVVVGLRTNYYSQAYAKRVKESSSIVWIWSGNLYCDLAFFSALVFFCDRNEKREPERVLHATAACQLDISLGIMCDVLCRLVYSMFSNLHPSFCGFPVCSSEARRMNVVNGNYCTRTENERRRRRRQRARVTAALRLVFRACACVLSAR